MSASTDVGTDAAVNLYQIQLTRLDGKEEGFDSYRGRLAMVVNVASKCGLTPHYAGLERLYQEFEPRGFTILGFPCNQFAGQEPGTADEIASFCSLDYGVTFPLFAKADVNGPDRHPLFAELTRVPDNEGREGDVLWNFEKFLVSPEGAVVARFDPRVEPEDPRILEAIRSNLPG